MAPLAPALARPCCPKASYPRGIGPPCRRSSRLLPLGDRNVPFTGHATRYPFVDTQRYPDGITMSPDIMILAYVGPETILPVTSALAAAGGVLALFWGQIRRFFTWVVGRIIRR
jgi:hypothetical protein